MLSVFIFQIIPSTELEQFKCSKCPAQVGVLSPISAICTIIFGNLILQYVIHPITAFRISPRYIWQTPPRWSSRPCRRPPGRTARRPPPLWPQCPCETLPRQKCRFSRAAMVILNQCFNWPSRDLGKLLCRASSKLFDCFVLLLQIYRENRVQIICNRDTRHKLGNEKSNTWFIAAANQS